MTSTETWHIRVVSCWAVVLAVMSGCGTTPRSTIVDRGPIPAAREVTSETTKLRLAEQLSTNYGTGRYQIYSIVDIERILGKPRNLRGAHKWFIRFKPDPIDLLYGPDAQVRRYRLSARSDLLVHFLTAEESISVASLSHQEVMDKPSFRAMSDQAQLNFHADHEWRMQQYGDKQTQCLEEGVEPRIVTPWGGRVVSMSDEVLRDTLMDEGENWMKDNMTTEAARCFDAAARVEPVSEQALWKAAVAHTAAGSKANAAGALKRFRQSATAEQQAQAAGAIAQLEAQIASLPEQ
jgi:hypothetical protein